MYQVRITKKAVKFLQSIPRNDQDRIREKIRQLEHDPFPIGHKKLKGNQGDVFRIRSGDYRILYVVEKEILTIIVTTVGHRKDVYQ